MDPIKKNIIIDEAIANFKIEKSIKGSLAYQIDQDLQSGLSIDDVVEKAKSGIYTDTWQNRKKGVVGQKYGSEKKEEKQQFTSAGRGSGSNLTEDEINENFSKTQKDRFIERWKGKDKTPSEVDYKIAIQQMKFLKTGAPTIEELKQAITGQEKSSSQGKHISDMSNSEKLAWAKKLGIQNPEKLSVSELNKQLVGKNIENEMAKFKSKKESSFKDVLADPKGKQLIEGIEGLDLKRADHKSLYQDYKKQLKDKFGYDYKD